MSSSPESERFRSEAHKYAAYLETPEGRLRSDLALANLEGLLPRAQTTTPLRALDVGGGIGTTAIQLARLGVQVTLLDSSEEMLDLANVNIRRSGLSEKVLLHPGDALQLGGLFQPASFDVIVCHNVLEYLEKPSKALRDMAGLLRHNSSLLSVLVRNRAGEVLKSALLAGNLDTAGNNLTAECGDESLYGGRVRLFTFESLQGMLHEASLTAVAERGVRVLADYLPSRVSRVSEYERIFELERKLGNRPEFAAVARYAQVFANCSDQNTGNKR